MEKTQRNNTLRYGLSIAILLFCEWFFFRNIIGTNALISDDGDGRLTMLITEHWFHVLKGEQPLTGLGFFFPIPHTLAFSDMFMGFGILHVLYRILGMDVFFAYKWTLISFHALGTVSTFYLFDRTLKTDLFWTLFGTIAFSFSNAYATLICHTQLVAISIVPLTVIFTVRFFQYLDRRGKRNLYAYLTILSLVLILYTAWYIAFFSALFATVTFISWCIVLHVDGESVVQRLKRFLNTVRFDLLGYGAVFIALCLPFAYLELDIMKTYGGWDYWSVSSLFLPEFIDIVNVSSDNYALGGFMDSLRLMSRNIANEELKVGFSIVLLSVYVCLLIWAGRKRRRATEVTEKTRLMLCQVVGISVLVCLLLPIRLSSNGVSLWWFVFTLFPGGSSIRAVSRIFLFLSLPMALVTAVMGNEAIKSYQKKQHRHMIANCVLLALVFVSNVRVNGVYSTYEADEPRAYLASVTQPPEDCETFFIVNGDEDHEKDEVYTQLDAYMIADHFNINTINGYSGVLPEDWYDIFFVNHERYLASVTKWIQDNNLSNVYAYNVAENTWTRFDIFNYAGKAFDPANEQIPDLLYGLWDWNPTDGYSWTMTDFKAILHDEAITEKGLMIKVGTYYLDECMQQQPGIDPKCSVYVNGEYVGEFSSTDGYNEYMFNVSPAENDLYNVELKSNFYFNLSELGLGGDTRDLSMALYYLGAAQ